MPQQEIILEKDEGIGTITLNRPEVFNAWDDEMALRMVEAIGEVSRDEEIRVLVITGMGKAFSSGADIGRFKRMIEGQVPFSETGPGRRLMDKPSVLSVPGDIRNLGKPVIAAVNGVAVGVGLSVALACDIRIASDDARFSTGFIKRGLIPDGGASYLLPRLVGPSMAAKLIFTGDMVDAKEAVRIGMVDEVVSPNDLMKTANELARRIAQNPPLALKMSKQILHRGIEECNFESQRDHETYLQNALFGTEDFKESVRAFMEKREPKFVGR